MKYLTIVLLLLLLLSVNLQAQQDPCHVDIAIEVTNDSAKFMWDETNQNYHGVTLAVSPNRWLLKEFSYWEVRDSSSYDVDSVTLILESNPLGYQFSFNDGFIGLKLDSLPFYYAYFIWAVTGSGCPIKQDQSWIVNPVDRGDRQLRNRY